MKVYLILVFLLINLLSCLGRSGSKSSLKSRNIAKHFESTLNRPKRAIVATCPFNQTIKCDVTSKYQSFDGTCNNINNPLYGAAHTPYTRYLTPKYDDGVNSPRTKSEDGGLLPNPRLISTTIVNDDLRSDNRWTHLFAIFSQFMTHDVTGVAVSAG